MNSLGSYITPSQKKCTVLKKYEYHEEKVEFPEDILYKDTLCLFPQEKLTLDKWTLPKTAFETLRKDFPQHLMSLSLDRAQGVTSSRLDVFPSLKNINILHLKGTITIDIPTATLIGRLSRVYELDISENIVLEKSFHHIFSRLDMLKYLYCNKCKGIDDFALQTIANNVSKFRKLSHIYMSENHDYSDEGMLALITVGPGIIIELDISGSNSLTTLSMAGVRRQMTSLRMLNISCIRGSGQSAYEFIAEGCVFLTELDVHKSSTLDDAALTLIGRKCSILRKLNISDCINVSDVGVESFVSEFQGQLQSINISGCIKCGGPSAFALSTISKKITSIRMNCLSMVTKASMKALWKKLPALEEFEMSADIRSSGTHRRSMIPHISDEVVTTKRMEHLKYVKVCGACQITDVGACFIAKNSPNLVKVDFSHCNAITDKLLVTLGKYAAGLKHVIIVGLGFVTDIGIKALCLGCPEIVTLDCNGCSGINDFGATEIKNLKKLETLNLSSCDFITDEAIVEIAKGCLELKYVSLNNMDMVTKASTACLGRYCTKLVRLSCLICNMVPEEFQQCCKYLPMSKPLAKCQLGSRPPTIVAYNQYVDRFNAKSFCCVQLQKYLRGWMQWLKHQRYVALRNHSALFMQRFYRGCKGRESVAEAKAVRRKLQKDARRLQKILRRLKARRFNRWKLFFRLKQYRATILLQRCTRGHLVRCRNFYKAKRIGGRKAKIFYMAQIYRVLLEARIVHRKITLVQSIARRYIYRKKYLKTIRGVKKFMRLCNIHLSVHYAVEHLIEEMISLEAEREQAGFNISIWAAAIIHNRLILDFTLECGVWFRNDLDTAQWVKENRREAATKIQARVRGRRTRKRLAAEKKERELGYASAIIVTRNVQRYVAIKKYRVWRPHMKRISALWRRLYKAGMYYFYSHFAKTIQRMFRRFKFLRDRHRAAITINRVARGRLGRIKKRKRVEEIQYDYCVLVQRKFRAHQRKKRRYFMYCKRYLAARRIQCTARKYIAEVLEKRRIAEERKAAYAKLQADKVAIVNKKKLKVIEKIKNSARDRFATRIQRSWRKFHKKKVAMKEAEESRKKVMAELKAENDKQGFSFGKLHLPNPKRLAKKAARKIEEMLKEEKIKDEDKPKYMVSVMKYQTQSITQMGIIDIAMTYGEGETNAFALRQEFLRSTKKRYFTILEGDLSGHLGLCMRLWIMKGNGNECICKLNVKNKPKNSSIAGIRNRVAQRRIDGVNIAWNEKVHIEIHGVCSLKRQESGFAVDGIRICHNSEAATDAMDDGFHLVADLKEFSLPSSLWFHGKTHAPDEGVFKLSVLETQEWYDERLRKCCLKFNLTESDVFQLRSTFDAINKGSYSFEIRTHEMFKYFGVPIINIGMWLVEAIEPRDANSITFSEYVHLISYFCVFGEQEKFRFIFGRGCSKSHQTMTKDQFAKTIEYLTEGFTGQKNTVKWVRAFDTYCNPKLKLMFFNDYERFFRTNPRACWGLNEIQTKFMQHNIGRNYWDTKCENFAYIRKGLGFVST